VYVKTVERVKLYEEDVSIVILIEYNMNITWWKWEKEERALFTFSVGWESEWGDVLLLYVEVFGFYISIYM